MNKSIENILFVEFETDGLDGAITEIFISLENSIELNKIEELEKYLDVENAPTLIFWHHYMPICIEKQNPELFKKFKGNFICLTQIAKFIINTRKIDKITKICTGRDHKGNAADDIEDLKDCYFYLKGKIN